MVEVVGDLSEAAEARTISSTSRYDRVIEAASVTRGGLFPSRPGNTIDRFDVDKFTSDRP